jgi:disulfide bond formation protein DsbB
MSELQVNKDAAWVMIFVAWILAAIATLGSLFFSEIMLYPPCVLCWYQRICMYPLVLLFLVGLFPISKSVVRFTLPLVCIGFFTAIYHNLLYYKILPESAAPCVQGISCTTIHIQWLGFITIPLLSLVAFSLILTLLILTYRKLAYEK